MKKDEEVRVALAHLLSASGTAITAKERTEVQEFIDANENKLALETFVGIFVEERRSPPAGVDDLVRSVAQQMGLDGTHYAELLGQIKPNQTR